MSATITVMLTTDETEENIERFFAAVQNARLLNSHDNEEGETLIVEYIGWDYG
jgi:hypothetical protein